MSETRNADPGSGSADQYNRVNGSTYGSRRRRTEEFGIVPKRLLRGNHAGPVCVYCVALFAVLDEEMRADGRPWRGRNKLAQKTGLSREVVSTHLRHLEACGLIHGRAARSEAGCVPRSEPCT